MVCPRFTREDGMTQFLMTECCKCAMKGTIQILPFTSLEDGKCTAFSARCTNDQCNHMVIMDMRDGVDFGALLRGAG